MKPAPEKLKEIVENLDSGFQVFIHKKTHEIIAIRDNDFLMGDEENPWQVLTDKIENESANYGEVEKMSSRDGFRMMDAFISEVNDPVIAARLVQALQGHKPFANFKLLINNSGHFREAWFTFKDAYMMEWVENQFDIDDWDEISNDVIH